MTNQTLENPNPTSAKSEFAKRVLLRHSIAANAGDDASLLGTTSDVASLCLIDLLATIVAEEQAEGDFAAYVQAKHSALSELAGDVDLPLLAADFLAAIKAGDVRFPVMVKGLPAVIGEVQARANAVADAITTSQEGA